jgi:hypothetical protein
MSIKDKDWVNKILSPLVTYEKVLELLCENHIDVWAEFSGEKIVKSIRAHRGEHFPVVTLVNYKSELASPFSPVRDLLPLLDVVLSSYEEKGYYTFRLLRRLDLFTSSRLPYWEDNPPLNRYNSYYEEVIEPGQESEYELYRDIAGNITYPVPVSIVTMCLKQEFRKYDGKEYLPLTRQAETEKKGRSTTYFVLGASEKGGLGQLLAKELKARQRPIVVTTRSSCDLSNNFVEDLNLEEIVRSGQQVTFIVNVFDYDDSRLQYEVTNKLLSLFRDYKNVQIVAIGSIAHYYNFNRGSYIGAAYQEAKQDLRDLCFHTGLHKKFDCRLLLVEPGTLSNFIEDHPDFKSDYFDIREFAIKVISLMDLNEKFMSVSMSGSLSNS